MKKPNLDIFEKRGLIRACKLAGYKGWIVSLEDESTDELSERIYSKINPDGEDWRKQYKKALDLFEIVYSETASDDELREKLYNHNRELLEKRISKMSEKKKKKLTNQLEDELDTSTLEKLQKIGRRSTGGGVGTTLVLQGGAVAITGSNLGICMLLTSGVSSISSLIGVTFPFAAYAGAAALGGKVLAVAGFLANPFVGIPILGAGLYYAYTKRRNRQYVNLAGVNYLIESKKKLRGMS